MEHIHSLEQLEFNLKQVEINLQLSMTTNCIRNLDFYNSINKLIIHNIWTVLN